MTRRPMVLSLALLLPAFGCADRASVRDRPAAGGDAVATWSGGSIGLTEIEADYPEALTPSCVTARQAPGGGSLEELTPCYREIAEGLVLERLVLADTEDVEQAVRELESYPQLRRQAYVQSFTRRLNDQIEITEAAIAAHYEANRERYRRPGSLALWNIFRRHQDPARPQETLAFLRGLKERYQAGETFAALAREYSQSETRLRDGQVGQVVEGQLPQRLEQVAFALGDGDVSDPILVRGGAVLLHVRNVVRPADLTLNETEGRIRQELRAEAVAQEIERRVADVRPPEGSVVLASDALLSALDGDDAEAVVLDLAGDRMTAAEARQLAGLAGGVSAVTLKDEARQSVFDFYEQRRKQALLVADLVANPDSDLRAEAERLLERAGTDALVDQRLRSELEEPGVVDDQALESYYRDNLPTYQSPLRFRLQVWDLPFGHDPPRQLARMEELRQALDSGKIALPGAVSELGGSLRELGWRAIDELPEIDGKARQYLLQTKTGGFSVPYQDDEVLHMIWVEEREEPRPLSYQEAAPRVRKDYLSRFEEPLFRKIAEEKLAKAGFFFDQEAVGRKLVPQL